MPPSNLLPGIMTWGTAYKTKLKWIQTKQNQFVPCIFFAHKRENAKIYYALLEILKLDDMFKMKIALFAQKIQKDKKSIPAFFLWYSYTSIRILLP